MYQAYNAKDMASITKPHYLDIQNEMNPYNNKEKTSETEFHHGNHNKDDGNGINNDNNNKQSNYLDGDIRPFLAVALFTIIGGAFKIAIIAYGLMNDSLFFNIASVSIGGVDSKFVPIWTFISLLPLLFGVAEIAIAVIGCLFVKLEKILKEPSVLEVLLHYLPQGKFKDTLSYLPFYCGSRLIFLILLIILTFVLGTATIVGYSILNDTISKAGTGQAMMLDKTFFRDVLDYTGAIFNQCCVSTGQSNQGYVIECLPDDTNPQCQSQISFSSQAPIQSCSCYKYGTSTLFKQRTEYVKNSQMCNLMKQAELSINDDDKIPGTGLSVRVMIPKEIKSVAIVGDKQFFGCGGGYVKGFQFIFSQWVAKKLQFYMLAVLIVTVIQFGLAVAGYLYSSAANKAELSAEEVEKRYQMQRGLDTISKTITMNEIYNHSQTSQQLTYSDARSSNNDHVSEITWHVATAGVARPKDKASNDVAQQNSPQAPTEQNYYIDKTPQF